MLKLYFLLLICSSIFVGCQKGSDNNPSPAPSTSDYYISFSANNKDYVFAKPYSIKMAQPQYPNSGLTYIDAYDDPLKITISLYRPLSGKPETIPVSNGSFAISRFEEYAADTQDKGTLTVTKIDDYTAEGTFTMNVYPKGSSLNTPKVSLTNGRFRLKF